MMAQLSSPETIAMVQKMMGDMPAEDMAATMRQAGVNITPEQAEQMQQQVWSSCSSIPHQQLCMKEPLEPTAHRPEQMQLTACD